MSHPVTIITADINSGKTTEAQHILRHRESCAGILSHGLQEQGREKYGYEVESVQTGERRVLLRSTPAADAVPVGRFYLDPHTLQWAIKQLKAGMRCDTLLVDEMGPLELAGGGYYDTVHYLLTHYRGELILVIRSGLFEPMLKKLGLQRSEVTVITPREETTGGK
ncbi:MAG: nucleoside-triphosphatase [Spirochaetota bacterium]